MFLHITVNELRGRLIVSQVLINILFYPLYYDIIINLTSLKITQAFHLLLGSAENQVVFWDFKIQNSVRISKDLDNQGSTVYMYTSMYVCMYV